MDEILEDLERTNNNLIRARAPERCFTEKPDIFGKKIINELCFKIVLKKFAKKYFEGLPAAATYISAMNDVKFEEFYQAIMFCC